MLQSRKDLVKKESAEKAAAGEKKEQFLQKLTWWTSRREKLEALVQAGKNPFEKVRYDRTAYSQDIKDDYASYEAITDDGGDANIIGNDGDIYNGYGEIEETD